jgi:DNA-binding NarL/FixJ family response regulator
MFQSNGKCTVAIVDAKNLRRASISSFIWPWANSEDLQPKTFNLDQVRELLRESTNLKMVIFSVGGESIASLQNLLQLKFLRALATDVPITIISDRENVRDITAAFFIGAQGFINTGMDPSLAHRALSFILNGGSYFPPSVMQLLTIGNSVVNGVGRQRLSDRVRVISPPH